MRVVVNGENHDFQEGQTVLGLVESLGLDPSRLAIELDGRIVHRPEWGSLVLREGSCLEIVHFVGGG